MEPRPMREIHEIREQLAKEWEGKSFKEIRAELDRLLQLYHLTLSSQQIASKR